jgi:4-amino-4-deoxy-L-arabinose transferase-like glycosyltransferase
MISLVVTQPPVQSESMRRQRLFLTWVPVLLMALVAILGSGFGGGGDDGTYLKIATQWVQQGPAIPSDHWAARWPLVLPLALSIKAFGIYRWSVALPSFLAASASLILLKRLGDKYFGEPCGILAAVILAIIPTFTRQATTAAIDPIELMLILSAFWLVERPVVAGLALGLAFQARETAVAALPVLLWLAGDWRRVLQVLAGFLVPFAVELGAFYEITGNPLFRRHLSLAHATIHSSELPFTTAHPLFNSELLKHWQYEPGIRVHWMVDGYLNLLANPATCFLPALSVVLLVRASGDVRRKAAMLCLAALFYSAVLIYGLSIDPLPRMFLPSFAALALAAAALCVRHWGPVPMASLGTIAGVSLFFAATHPPASRWQSVANQWVVAQPGQIEASQRSYFLFGPRAPDLPSSGRPYLLLLKSARCVSSSPEDPFSVDHLPIAKQEMGGRAGDHWYLCLYRLTK